jgi:hypothetical protein
MFSLEFSSDGQDLVSSMSSLASFLNGEFRCSVRGLICWTCFCAPCKEIEGMVYLDMGGE